MLPGLRFGPSYNYPWFFRAAYSEHSRCTGSPEELVAFPGQDLKALFKSRVVSFFSANVIFPRYAEI